MQNVIQFEKKVECQLLILTGETHSEVIALDVGYVKKSKYGALTALLEAGIKGYNIIPTYVEQLVTVFPRMKGYHYIKSDEDYINYFK